MKKVAQIVLALIIVALAYVIYKQIATPLEFEKELKYRKAAVVDRIKDIRAAERAFKAKYQRFTPDFDTLINFVLYDSMQVERKIVDEDDSVAMAQLKKAGKQNVEKYEVAVIDTIFAPKRLTEAQVRELRYIPGAAPGVEFILNAGMAEASGVTVPVIEIKAPYKLFMDTVKYRQELINKIDEDMNIFNEYPGVKVGDMTRANNEAGNWGE